MPTTFGQNTLVKLKVKKRLATHCSPRLTAFGSFYKRAFKCDLTVG
uniref:Uncharacterized protein n=1 Tax=Anguilla anguilla TaxID=7936 RepID=A0A0E9PQ45_ANGAN